jgi:hypothetical protein
LPSQEIEPYLVNLDNDTKRLKEEFFRMSWYMRGGVQVNDLMYLYGPEERKMISKIVSDNIELTEKTKMPLI